jgi:hypothetical protein
LGGKPERFAPLGLQPCSDHIWCFVAHAVTIGDKLSAVKCKLIVAPIRRGCIKDARKRAAAHKQGNKQMFRAHLSALSRQGLYKPEGDDCFGYVRFE